jgi:hypothetical protein
VIELVGLDVSNVSYGITSHARDRIYRHQATARLPHVDIEIVHHRSADDGAEQISIHLRAIPSFEAFGHFLESVNPVVFWSRFAQMLWSPWLSPRSFPVPWDVARLPAAKPNDAISDSSEGKHPREHEA